ncbi:hypothetical protein [Empedobacter falsenii]|uniref:hypothetical protein n=1 Tax=Empedobacter falsenii TaxID=343874 RepID=UPI001C8D937B|nr:hypothetical protein [Empedobacter falsenii]MBY0066808.1 hypothetical protein [Empedobacter falsenii]
MKTEILNIIKHPTLDNPEKFNQLFDFYKKNPSKDRNFESNFNRLGFTEHQFSKLIYEVKKIHKISDLEVVQHEFNDNSIRKPWGFCETPEEKCNMNYCDENGCQNRTRHLVEDSELNENINKENQNKEVPIRQEFPFLNTEDCPEEFKILVNDKITAYHKMVAGRGALDDPNTPEEQRAEIAQSVSDADMLNSLIYDELKHYQDTGEILGNHEIFATHNLKKAIENMTAEQKAQRIETLKGQIRVAKSALTKAEKKKDTEKVTDLKAKIEALELERNLVIKSLEKANN